MRNLEFQLEVPLKLDYKGKPIGEGRIDILVSERLVVELKAAEANPKRYRRQVVNYLRATRLQLGLVINFDNAVLKDGIARVVYTE